MKNIIEVLLLVAEYGSACLVLFLVWLFYLISVVDIVSNSEQGKEAE